MANIKETRIPINGRLKDHYNLLLSVRHDKSKDFKDILDITLMLNFDGNQDFAVQLVNKGTVRLYINDTVVKSDSIDIDTKYNKDIKLIEFHIEDMFLETTRLHITADLEMRDESKYLEDTSIETYFTVVKENKPRLFIDLDATDAGNLILCTVEVTTEPDLLEYKTNFQDWVKLNVKNRNFAVKKEEKPMWIQARGKIYDEYVYSNVKHIIP